MSKKRKDIIIAIVLILFGLITFITSMQYTGKAEMSDDPGPSFLPMLCSGAITILAVIFLITCIRNKKPDYVKVEEKESEVIEGKHDLYRLLITIALLLLYVLTFTRLGFLVSSILYLILQQLVFSEKGSVKWVRILIISIVLPLFCQLLFVNVLNYMLPMGILKYIGL